MFEKNQLGNHWLDNISSNIRQPKRPSLEAVCQSLMIDTEQVQKRGVKIVDADRILDREVTKVIRFTNRDSPLDTATSHPDTEGVLVMVTSCLGTVVL